MAISTPATRPASKPVAVPANPRFSSGPCAKPPTFDLTRLSGAPLGRSHRASEGKQNCLPRSRRPAKSSACLPIIASALFRHQTPVRMKWPCGRSWANGMPRWSPGKALARAGSLTWSNSVKIAHTVHTADYGAIVDMATLNYNHDVCFTWNGTTSGVRMPSGDVIPADRAGLTLCDATSAAFAMDLPWDKLDVTTFSWQKVLGGEAAHGMLILSPRAVERLESYTPPWPLPKIFRLTKGGKLIEGIFTGATINTPSMLCVEDYLLALDWAKSVGGLQGLIARADANAAAIVDFVAAHDWLEFLATDPATRSNTSVCLKFSDPRITDGAAFAKAVAKRLADENVALDIGAYRDAPAGLRIWCGGTVETADIEAMLPWLEWAFETEINA